LLIDYERTLNHNGSKLKQELRIADFGLKNPQFAIRLPEFPMSGLIIPAGCLLPTAYWFSPAHKVHNLYLIIFLQHGRGPISTSHHVLIELDCYSLGCEVELGD